MSAAPRRWAAELLHFWFCKLRPEDWFRGGAHIDEELRLRFERELLALSSRPASEFLRGPVIARAAILLFDQLPRNLYRGTPRAFAFDPLALSLCHAALAKGWDAGLNKAERQFLAMPLQHSERISDQLLSLEYFTALEDPVVLGFARAHYRMIARFGRFPHRNEVLGRVSSPAEIAAVEAGHSW